MRVHVFTIPNISEITQNLELRGFLEKALGEHMGFEMLTTLSEKTCRRSKNLVS